MLSDVKTADLLRSGLPVLLRLHAEFGFDSAAGPRGSV